MGHNPFETPQAQPDWRDRAPPGRFDLGRSLHEGWRATWDNFPLWLGVGAVGLVVCLFAAVTIIGYFLVVPVVAWGATRFLLNMMEGRAQFNDLFSGFSRYGSALGAMLGFIILLICINMVGSSLQLVGGFMESAVLAGIGALFSLVWAFAVIMRFYFGAFYIVDQGLGPIEAMKASWAATGEQKLNTILLALLSGVVMIAGVLALLVGVIPASMVAYGMWASAYRQMTGQA